MPTKYTETDLATMEKVDRITDVAAFNPENLVFGKVEESSNPGGMCRKAKVFVVHPDGKSYGNLYLTIKDVHFWLNQKRKYEFNVPNNQRKIINGYQFSVCTSSIDSRSVQQEQFVAALEKCLDRVKDYMVENKISFKLDIRDKYDLKKMKLFGNVNEKRKFPMIYSDGFYGKDNQLVTFMQDSKNNKVDYKDYINQTGHGDVLFIVTNIYSDDRNNKLNIRVNQVKGDLSTGQSLVPLLGEAHEKKKRDEKNKESNEKKDTDVLNDDGIKTIQMV